jgi:Family of unknown function (DUF5706)
MSEIDNFDELGFINDEDPPVGMKGNILNLVRTTQRNYINLTNIADNKAHILISINSLMLTILVPILLSNYGIILEMKLSLPMGIFALTCLLTIVFSIKVLTPFNGKKNKSTKDAKALKSPFFFSNYADLTLDEYKQLFNETTSSKNITNQVIIGDLYYFGINLDSKYKLVIVAYNVFYIGMILSFVTFTWALIF